MAKNETKKNDRGNQGNRNHTGHEVKDEIRQKGVRVVFHEDDLSVVGLKGKGVSYTIAGQPIHDNRKAVVEAMQAVLQPTKEIASLRRDREQKTTEAQGVIDQTNDYMSKVNAKEGTSLHTEMTNVIAENEALIEQVKTEYDEAVAGFKEDRDNAMEPFIEVVSSHASLRVVKDSSSSSGVLVILDEKLLDARTVPNMVMRITQIDLERAIKQLSVPLALGRPHVRANWSTTTSGKRESTAFLRVFAPEQETLTVVSVSGGYTPEKTIEQVFELSYGFAHPVVQLKIRAEGDDFEWLMANGNVSPAILVNASGVVKEEELTQLGEQLQALQTSAAEKVEVKVADDAAAETETEQDEADEA